MINENLKAQSRPIVLPAWHNAKFDKKHKGDCSIRLYDDPVSFYVTLFADKPGDNKCSPPIEHKLVMALIGLVAHKDNIGKRFQVEVPQDDLFGLTTFGDRLPNPRKLNYDKYSNVFPRLKRYRDIRCGKRAHRWLRIKKRPTNWQDPLDPFVFDIDYTPLVDDKGKPLPNNRVVFKNSLIHAGSNLKWKAFWYLHMIKNKRDMFAKWYTQDFLAKMLHIQDDKSGPRAVRVFTEVAKPCNVKVIEHPTKYRKWKRYKFVG